MFSLLIENVLLITILVLMYLGSLAANTVLGTYHSIANLKESFSKEKLISGLVRGGIVLGGALMITVIISLLPEVLAAFGITAEVALFEGISVIAMGGVLASTITRYLGDAVKKLFVILGNKTVAPEIKEEVK